jgi:hypothetical protein
MDVEKELSKNQVVLMIMPADGYNNTIIKHLKKLSKKTVCFVTLSKTYESMKEIFKKNKINSGNIVVIDAISKSLRKVPDQTDGCYFVSSPNSMTELEIAVLKVLRHGFEYLVFDSLSTMLVYQKNAPVAKFVSALANNARQNNAKALFYTAKSAEQSQMVGEVSTMVDKAIYLSK